MFSNMCCHDFAVMVSFFACIFGLFLSQKSQYIAKDEAGETERILFQMSFSYWLVYCCAFAAQKFVNTDIESITTSLKITTALSYFLTFSCILSLPLHKFAIHEIEE